MNAGYREIEHTADWALEIWAPDMAALLQQAARGMYALLGIHLAPDERVEKRLHLSAPDEETLLVTFLEELLFLQEVENLGFDVLDVEVAYQGDGLSLRARLGGAPVQALRKEIKAVTWSDLHVRRTEHGLKTVVVFDV